MDTFLLSCKTGNTLEIDKMLYEHGNLDLTFDDNAAVRIASHFGREIIVKTLLSYPSVDPGERHFLRIQPMNECTAVPKTMNISTLKLIGQFNNEFIIVKSEAGLIYLIDQHAADERIRLENLLKDQKRNDDLDSLKSVACRGAVMFGEKLSRDHMNNILECLANCKFPLICAHGRPSIYPICHIRD